MIFAPIFAQTLKVDYVEGSVEVLKASKWTVLAIGEIVPLSASVKLPEGSLLELNYNGATISLVDAGTYNLKNIVSSSKETKSWNLVNVIGLKVAVAVGNEKNAGVGVRGAESAAGVRGNDAGKSGSDKMEWQYGDESAGSLETAKALINEKNYSDAIKMLLENVKDAGADDLVLIDYYLAYSYSMTNQNALALKYLNRLVIDKKNPIYSDYALLKSKLLVECSSYKKALVLLNEYLELYPAGDAAQSALILESYCYKSQSDAAKQKVSLLKAKNLNPNSVQGKIAADLLKTL